MPEHVHSTRRIKRRAVQCLLVAVAFGALMGCGSDQPPATRLAGPDTYWTVAIDQRAVSLALTAHQTIQLNAHVLSIDGTPIAEAVPVYSTSDSAVRVTPTGLVTARYQTGSSPARVIASIFHENRTFKDTVLVHVDSLPPAAPLESFTLHSEGDSAKVAASTALVPTGTFLTLAALDANGAQFPDSSLLTYYESSDPSIAIIGRTSGAITPNLPGRVRFYATTLAFGVARRDSIDFLVTYPLSAIVLINEVVLYDSLTPLLEFQPRTVTIGVGGTVEWANFSLVLPIDVVFDDPTDVAAACGIYGCDLLPETGTGDMPSFAWDTTTYEYSTGHKARSFPKAGVYRYHSVLYGTTGTVVVKEGL